MKRAKTILFAYMFLCLGTAYAETGLFRTKSAYIPPRGLARFTGFGYLTSFEPNSVLKSYGVTNTQIATTGLEFTSSLNDYIALVGEIPFYHDMFKQKGNKGQKTGPGDMTLGMQISLPFKKFYINQLGIRGVGIIPAKIGKTPEPFGFRNFASGRAGMGLDALIDLDIYGLKAYLNGGYRNFGDKRAIPAEISTEIFYDSMYGLLGVGASDNSGKSATIFQDQLRFGIGLSVTITPKMGMLLEIDQTTFVRGPKREPVMRIVPGFRIGRTDGFSLMLGMDSRISGHIPSHTLAMRLDMPNISPRSLKRFLQILTRKRIPNDRFILSRNWKVAVMEFNNESSRFQRADELYDAFTKKLQSTGHFRVINTGKIKELVSKKRMSRATNETRLPGNMAREMGADYLITGTVIEYKVTREQGFGIPYLLRFPKTTKKIDVLTGVIDLATGEVKNTGIVTAKLSTRRGFRLFPINASGDIEYLSMPQNIKLEKELIDTWAKDCVKNLFDNLDWFMWPVKGERKEVVEDTVGRKE